MAVDRNKVISGVSALRLQANADGLIWAFGVFITQTPANFWNRIAFNMVGAADGDIVEAVEELLVNAAHECGYHTGNGIMTSKEWQAIVQPMVGSPEDALHGAFAVCTGLGWGKTEIAELVPGERMVVRASDYYEAEVAAAYPGGKAQRKMAYMLRGVCAAFMDLAYGGAYDPKGQTSLYTFRCKQTKGIECGDPCGEFMVVKADQYEG